MEYARPTDWEHRPLPDKRVTISLDRTFDRGEIDMIQRGVIPDVMEDKWFIYWLDGDLYLHRSWSGICICVVHFERVGDCWRMASADVNRDPDQYGGTCDDTDANLISYYIDLLLLRRPVDLEFEDGENPANAAATWGMVGRAMLGQHPEGDPENAEGDEPEKTDSRHS